MRYAPIVIIQIEKKENADANTYPDSVVMNLENQLACIVKARPSVFANKCIFLTFPPQIIAITPCPISWINVCMTATYFPSMGICRRMTAASKYIRKLVNVKIVPPILIISMFPEINCTPLAL